MCVNIRSVFRLILSKGISSSNHLSHVRCVSVSVKFFSSRIFRQPHRTRRWKGVKQKEDEEDENEKDEDADEKELDKLLDKSFQQPGSGFQVCVIQPYIKWGFRKKKNTTPQLQLLEAVTLIKTLREWSVVHQQIVPLQTIHGKTIFGSGVLEILRETITKSSEITAVFISLNTLTLHQQMVLEAVFQVPVFDRHSIIMHIFKEHAKTKEAKLQIQLAQLPYVWSMLRGFNSGVNEKLAISANFLNSGPKRLSERREIFKMKEGKIKREILELRNQRLLLREKRKKQEIPVVAVIGYTNAGKTSLIKALTGKESLQPEDYLFATLDVSCHLGELPSGLKAFFLDTIGFINDIPTYLFESFLATLEDVALAHVILHVRDISHPDTIAQNDKVNEILNMLNIPEVTLNNLVTVGNKIDLLEKKQLINYKDLICVSSSNMTGIDVLRQELEEKILLLSDKTQMIIRVESGSTEYNWLHEWSTVVKETPDDKNNQYMFVETIISSSCLEKFKHKFIKNYKR